MSNKVIPNPPTDIAAIIPAIKKIGSICGLRGIGYKLQILMLGLERLIDPNQLKTSAR